MKRQFDFSIRALPTKTNPTKSIFAGGLFSNCNIMFPIEGIVAVLTPVAAAVVFVVVVVVVVAVVVVVVDGVV